MYISTDLSKSTFPTVKKISAAITKADAEDPKNRDVRELMAILRRAASANPRLSGHILTRKTALLSFDWRIAADDEIFAEEAAKASRRISAALRKMVRYHTDVPLYGVSALSLSWDTLTEDGKICRVVRRYDPTEIERFDETRVGFLDEKGKTTTTVAKEDLSTETLVDYDDLLERGGTLRSVVFHAALAHETLVEWSKLNARMKGVIAGIVDAEKYQSAVERLNMTKEESDRILSTLEDTLKKAGEDNYLKTLSAVDVQLKSIVEAAAGGSYKSFIEALNSDIAIAILGQANTSELPSGGGSRAALQVLDLIRTDILFADMERTTALANDLLLLDYRVNMDPNATQIPYRFRFVSEETKDAEAAARTFETLSRIGGIEVSKAEFYDRLGLSIPTPEEETITFAAKQSIL